MNHVLVVDDEADIRSSLEEILREEGYGVATAATAAEAMVLIEDAPYDAVLLDIWLPDRDGLDVLADIHVLAPEKRPEVVIISGHGTIEAAVKATKLGAYDFLEKPLSLDRTLIVLKNAASVLRISRSSASSMWVRCSPVKACRSRRCASRSASWRPVTAACSSTANRVPARN
jgi:two-component system nitrogen regulation response regulator NtrX